MVKSAPLFLTNHLGVTLRMGITLTVSTILALLGLAIAFFYMKKVTSIPVDLGLNPEESKKTQIYSRSDCRRRDGFS